MGAVRRLPLTAGHNQDIYGYNRMMLAVILFLSGVTVITSVPLHCPTDLTAKVVKIEMTTGTQWNAGTNAYVFAVVGGSNGSCTTNRMTNPGNEREPGKTDSYKNEENLGDCFQYGIGKPSDITFYISSSKERITPPGALVNAWYPTVALVELSDGNRYSCSMEGWLGSSVFHGTHVPSMSCQLVNEEVQQFERRMIRKLNLKEETEKEIEELTKRHSLFNTKLEDLENLDKEMEKINQLVESTVIFTLFATPSGPTTCSILTQAVLLLEEKIRIRSSAEAIQIAKAIQDITATCSQTEGNRLLARIEEMTTDIKELKNTVTTEMEEILSKSKPLEETKNQILLDMEILKHTIQIVKAYVGMCRIVRGAIVHNI